MILRWLGSISACALLASCSPIVDTRGHTLEDVDMSQIIEGQSGPEDVRAILGSPSTVSNFGHLTWYYINERKETMGFYAPEVADQKVVAIHFDEAERVSKIEDYGKAASKPVEFVKKETPTEGHELGIMEQMLGNFGRFNAPGKQINPRDLGR